MSMRLEMLQVARVAPKLLGDSAPLVAAFLKGQQHASGGFLDRSSQPDLYYTIFGMDSLLALQGDWKIESIANFVEKNGSGENLDFVHRCCLARCWNALNLLAPHRVEKLSALLQKNQTPDGGYNQISGSASGTVYGAFLALGAAQDLKAPVQNAAPLAHSLLALRTPDGGWANERSGSIGSTTATAAALTMLRNLGQAAPPDAIEWLRAQMHSEGGFRAAPLAPIPDLLSTATALHALSDAGLDLEPFREPCLDFLDSLWTNEGSFHGHWTEDILDCEYTFYGLLALGHLAM